MILKFNHALFLAYTSKGLRAYQVAKEAGIERTRFSRILTGRLKAKPEEVKVLSTILRVPQKKLFVKE